MQVISCKDLPQYSINEVLCTLFTFWHSDIDFIDGKYTLQLLTTWRQVFISNRSTLMLHRESKLLIMYRMSLKNIYTGFLTFCNLQSERIFYLKVLVT